VTIVSAEPVIFPPSRLPHIVKQRRKASAASSPLRPGRLLDSPPIFGNSRMIWDANAAIPFARRLFSSLALDKAGMNGLKADKLYAIKKIRKDQTKNHFMD
jgi:hypothetical protein